MTPVQKRLLDASRVREIGKAGFGWIDRRFVTDGFFEKLTSHELSLYFFLCLASDHRGLSFFGDRRVARTLRISLPALEEVRRSLVRKDLIVYHPPLYQVVALPETATLPASGRGSILRPAPAGPARDASIPSLGQILRRLP